MNIIPAQQLAPNPSVSTLSSWLKLFDQHTAHCCESNLNRTICDRSDTALLMWQSMRELRRNQKYYFN